MRAFAIPDFDRPGAVADLPKPEPTDGQLLIRVQAAAVNPMDAVVAAGWMAQMVEHRKPLVPGFDYAGTVEALGPGVQGIAIGDRVYGAVGKAIFGEGSWAEYTTVNVELANGMPEGVDPIAAAALPTAGTEALALVDAIDPKPGQTVVVTGASGGVGTFAVQLVARTGATVVAATRGSDEEYLRALGATDIVRSGEGLAEQLAQRFPDGVDAIIDLYNDAAGLRRLAPAVRPGGWIVSPKAQGVEDMFADTPVQAALVSAALGRVAELGELVARGGGKVPGETMTLEEAGGALEAISSGGVRGKLVIALD
jgi:NADPH2:quinone reductase